ncbi:MAG: sulfide/dihydroorotate dehydrogenase-like FAD/NAD-binding protein [Phascolarctobacterium sp.]|nr:sulfide/dihydroorotate dehydrogenase-like FAD/NAD-binding protein [Candidatus Phascolarctobacterium caballi]
MNIILKKAEIAKNTFEFLIRTPYVAQKCEPGQFVILHVDENAERVPMTIADFDRVAGTITLIIQDIGSTSHHICHDFNEGDNILDLAGPLGQPAQMGNFGKVVVISGGIGVAPVFPIARKYKQLGNYVIGITGAKSKEFLIWQDKMQSICDENFTVTEDGSAGEKGLVTDILDEILQHDKVVYVLTIGSVPMMKKVTEITKKHGIRTVASLNAIMLDGLGMCGGCRVTVDGKTKFACCDGPEFDAHLVDFDNLLMRQGMYHSQESEVYGCGGQCKCQAQ